MHILRRLVILLAFCLYIPSLFALTPVRLNSRAPYSELDTHFLPTLSLSYAAGKTLGIDENYASLGIFYSPLPACAAFHPFVDLRAHRMQDNLWASSVGAGLRMWCSDYCSAVGFNAFYDFRQADLGDFHQAGFGFEWISSTWQFSLNGYLPFKNKYVGPVQLFDDFIGDFFYTCQHSTYSRKGGDFEIGRTCGCYDNFLFYFGAGSYYFHSTPGGTYGVKLRTSLSVDRYLCIEGLGVFDKSCHLLLQMKISINIPFDICCDRPPPCCDGLFLLKPVSRNDMIILQDQCCWKGTF